MNLTLLFSFYVQYWSFLWYLICERCRSTWCQNKGYDIFNLENWKKFSAKNIKTDLKETSNQCDHVGRFLKVLGNKISSNMIGKFLGYFLKPHSYAKTVLAIFWGNYWKKMGYFLLQHLVTLYPIEAETWFRCWRGKTFLGRSLFTSKWKIFFCNALTCTKCNANLSLKYTLKLKVTFKMICSWRFSLGGTIKNYISSKNILFMTCSKIRLTLPLFFFYIF